MRNDVADIARGEVKALFQTVFARQCDRSRQSKPAHRLHGAPHAARGQVLDLAIGNIGAARRGIGPGHDAVAHKPAARCEKA